MICVVSLISAVALGVGDGKTPTCNELGWLPTFAPAHALNNAVWAMTTFDDGRGDGPALYVGGQFTTAGGETVNRIARWDGAGWAPLGSGVHGTVPPVVVTALAVFDDGVGGGPALYAGGQFTSAGDATVNGIAKWNGSTWSALGTGVDGHVSALAVFDDGTGGGSALYVGGEFNVAGGVLAHRIAKWNGREWSALGDGMNASVSALAVFDDGSGGGPALYAAGVFTMSGATPLNRVARWNGSTWSAVGPGFNSVTNALVVHDDGLGSGPSLYAGGQFNATGGNQVNRIARWDGIQWIPLGTGMNDSVMSLTTYADGAGTHPALYAGGWFTTAGGAAAPHVARWDGASWSALDAGVDSLVTALHAVGHGVDEPSGLYVGGIFATSPAGDAYLAKWGCVDPAPPCEPGDLNCDGVVDGRDLAQLLGAWGPCDAPPCTADLNDDGVIDGDDLAILLGAWAP